jgi:hypothetical protein
MVRVSMVGARPVKNSLWFELSVAAYFSTQPIKIDNCLIDLKNAQVDPNHRPYKKTRDIAGYPSEIDVTITKIGYQYNISCKFSEKSDAILKPNSPDFLKAILELMSLYHIEEDYYGLQMKYLLVTNFVISQALNSKNTFSTYQLETLSRNLIKIAKRSGNKVNESLFKPDKLRSFLPLLIIYPITMSELEKLHKDNADFTESYKSIASNLLTVPKRGLRLNQIVNADFTLFCDSKSSHKDCYDCIIEKKICHLGHIAKITRKLNQLLSDKSNELLTRISCEELGVNIKNVIVSDALTPEAIAHITASILNNRVIVKTKHPHTFYVLPASFTIFAFDAFKLVNEIKAKGVFNERIYPSKVPELNNLNIGFKAIQEIIQLAYLKGLSYWLPKSEIIFDNEEAELN